MSALHHSDKLYLQDTFGDRISFDEVERKIYSHDVGELPRLIKPIIGNILADAVIQPESVAELAELVTWAREHSVALTPRGKATSGYGGLFPIKQGLIVDFYRLNNVLGIDKENETVTVQAGIVWEALDTKLKKEGLTLRLYPSSYPSSTVGGWLAQGGAGIGSYESGWFRENVISAKVVLPTGEIKTFAGDDLDYISDAEGTTGIITEVTLSVMPDEGMAVLAAAFETPEALQSFAAAVVERDLPIWSLLFINPKMAELKNASPLKEHLGHAAETAVTLPDVYIATIAFRPKDGAAVASGVESLLSSVGGTLLKQSIAVHEWEERFNVMSVKRLGPSLVPAEVVVPLKNLSKSLSELKNKITQPIVSEGVLIKNGAGGKPEVVILGFIPADQRKFNYHFVFGLSLSVMKIAEQNGGRAYSTGLYFTKKAPAVFGKARLAALKRFKKETDPKGLMNPGKVHESTPVSLLIGLAGNFERIIRVFGNGAGLETGVRIGEQPVRNLPADVAWDAYSCSQCGYCVDTCDQFYGRGWESQSPRGKWFWMREYMEGREEWNDKMVGTILACTTCEICNDRCCEALPIEPSWMKLRGQLINEEKRMTIPPFEMMAETFVDNGNIWAGYRKNRSDWFPEDLNAKHGPETKSKAVYFAGCTASYVETDIGIASVRLLDAAGVDFTYLGEQENCCGTPMLVAGKWDIFAENLKHNLEHIKAIGADTVISSCPACDMMWRHVYPDWAKKLGIEYNITAKHYSEVVSEKIANGAFSFPQSDKPKEKVTWHDSCHIGRVSGVYEPPRDLIRANPNSELVEMEHNRENGLCCGSVLTLIKDPPVAEKIGAHRLQEAVDIDVQKVLALCPCCEFQLRVAADKKNIPVEIVDLARYSAEALGFELPDPNPEVQKQWATFEAMINLMKPEGFAALMKTMWPELVGAMPMGMGGMMRFAVKVPGMTAVMKPMFPVLFPKLLPVMMPKVMDTMLARVAERVPMPDYMKEQMPTMMPKVMNSLMPHMIGDVVPLVTDSMIAYLKEGKPGGKYQA
jgi:Fe-S oxidoreductase/FAD/FMN-containing dehydrogenase